MTSSSARAWRAPAAAALAALLLTATPATALAAPAGVSSADGADLMSVSMDSDGLSLRFRDARQAAEGAEGTDPAAVEFGPAGGLGAAVPASPDYAFLGRPGTPVWSLSAGGSRFPSLDFTGIDPGDVEGGKVTLNLESAEGPGDFAAYTVSRWGEPSVLLDSDGRTSAELPAGERVGGVAWTFDTPGDYRLNLAVSAKSGGAELTQAATYSVEVPTIIVPSASAAPAAVGQTAQSAATAEAAEAAEVATPASGEATAKAAEQKVISDGHVDMGPQLTGDTFRIRLRDDTVSPPVWRELTDVVLKATDKAKIEIPAGSGYAFLGTAGDPIWMLPQTQQSGIVWPGWNTQHESIVSGVDGGVTWTVKSVDGPGAFKLFLTSSFGTPDVLFNSAKALPQQLAIPPNTHAHGNWAFTKAGLYKIGVEMSAKTTAGKTVTDSRTLAIAVGDATDAEAGFGSDSDSGSDSGSGNDGAADGSDEAGGDQATGGGSGGALAKTGASIALFGGIGLVLVVVGVVAMRLGRRRESPSL